ncbi:YheC/YheD family protein [Paenibacillus sp. IB182496]|uniref:YheC/YheD family protein n=1 Tax=Paenibacillus sabuli TaxID=2772509 RepID=A0A927BWP8_9BACL|nr:YheC/YheD family protein [Paenibacillus sabuli]MBD2848263.1 YheC/YheD family protein [Paenibacillus sabuli]
MIKTKVAVQVIGSDNLSEDALMLGENYLKQWKIPQGQPVIFKFGSFRQHVKIMPVRRLNGMRIGPTLARRMGLHGAATLRMHFRPQTMTLSLGPVIGVLISRDFPGVRERPFGTITLFCKELVDACRKQGAYVYFFTPGHVGSSTSSLQAWVYGGGWRRTEVPIADVINNRLTSRKLENKPSLQHFLKEVKSRYQTQLFNEKFLDKTEVFDALRRDSGVHRYLPESHMLRNYSMLKAMCARYATVFLKPVRGSLGKGIIRITRGEDGTLHALHTTPIGTRKQTYASAAKLFASLSGKLKTVRYQMQQGLQLMEVQKRPVDFRALVQKTSTGAWGLTSIVARIAGSQHFVSNLARGGKLSPVSDAIAKSNLSGHAKKEAAGRLQRAALDIARGVDTHIPAHFGELGIDLALDASGRVWLLEVNSKPSKNDNTPLSADQKIRPSVKLMIQYARYLTGF